MNTGQARIALICTGLDSVRRGYETHQRMLFDRLKNEEGFSVVLFKRNGKAVRGKTSQGRTSAGREVSLHTPSRTSWIAKKLGKFIESAFYWDMAFFGLAFLVFVKLMRMRFDVIFVIEPGVAQFLRRIRRFLPGSPRVIYTHGIGDAPEYYFWFADEIIEVNIVSHDLAEASDDGRRNIWLIPHFVEPPADLASNEMAGKALRESLGIQTKYVLLHVGVVCKDPKRVDYVIREAGQLSDEWTLVLCGPVQDPELLALGRHVLGERFRNLSVPREKIDAVYKAADVLVLASLNEGFPMVIIEAMSHGLPVLVPNLRRFEWMVKSEESCIDVTKEGELAYAIRNKASDAEWRLRQGERNKEVFNSHYVWPAIRKKYLEVIQHEPPGNRHNAT